jgi:hypothetical protein
LSATFDDPNLVSAAGLAPVVSLAQFCGLGDLVADKLTLKAKGGVNAQLKVPALVAGMVAGADSIDDMDLLGHGGMDRLFAGIRAPSTLGTFLRAFTFGHVRQLDSVAAAFLTRLAAATPLLPGADQVTYLDWTTRCGRPTATPSRAPATATPRSRASTRCWPRSPHPWRRR